MGRLFGEENYTAEAVKMVEPYKVYDHGNIWYYKRVPAETMLEVAATLPRAHMDLAQNYSPTFAGFMKLAQAHPDAEFMGYVVTPARHDERISVEGFVIPVSVVEEAGGVRAMLAGMDGRGGPDEFSQVTDDGGKFYRNDEAGDLYRFWWD